MDKKEINEKKTDSKSKEFLINAYIEFVANLEERKKIVDSDLQKHNEKLIVIQNE